MGTIEELRSLVREVIAEAKKKKKKSDELEEDVDPPGYSYSPTFDFSAPLGAYNLYRQQGAVNWGPMTSAGPKVDDRVRARTSLPESAVRRILGVLIQEELGDISSWDQLSEAFLPPSAPPKGANVWTEALHWYDFQHRGLGEKKKVGKADRKKKS